MKPQLIEVNLSGNNTIQIKKVDQYFLDAPFHFHHLCELVWIEKGFGKRIVGDNIDNFEDGDLVLMGPNLPHIWQNDEIFSQKNEQYRTMATVVYFPCNFLTNITDDSNIIGPIKELINKSWRGLKITGETQKKVANVLAMITGEKGLAKIISFLKMVEYLSQSKEFQYLASISYENHYDTRDTGRINKVYQFLLHNFQRDIQLQELANLSNMTLNAFCRYFKSRTAKSFTQFLNELRIGHACKLLHKNNFSISDVCYQCGYNNLANFNKSFKSIMGSTPSMYAKQIQIAEY